MSDSIHQTPSHEDDEISLKELILKLKEFWYELWRNWLLITLFILPFLLFFIYKAFTTPKTYKADLTFMLNDEGGAGIGGVSSILGNFGLGGGAGGEYNLEKMLELVRTRKLIQTVLFEKTTLDQKNDYFANHLIDLYAYHEKWDEDTTGLKDLYFKHDSINIFNTAENNALKILHASVIGNSDKGVEALLSTNLSETTAIMGLSLNTENESLSISMLESIFENLSSYYIEKAIEKPLHTYKIIAFKTDSIETELRNAEYSLANFMDTSFGLLNKKDQLKELQLKAKIEMLYRVYGESLKNKELAEFTLQEQTPVIQAIDYPIPPLEPENRSLIKAIIIACLLGGFLGSVFVIGRKIIRDALAD